MKLRGRLPALLAVILVPAVASGAGIAIDGRVVDPGGKEIAGARVTLGPVPVRYEAGLQEAAGRPEPEPAASVVSGPDGRFVLMAPGPGMWKVGVEAPGFLPMWHPLIPLVEETSLPPVQMSMDVGLRVRVLTPEGRPVAGARVWGEVRRRFSSSTPPGWEPDERRGVTGPDGESRLPRAASESVRPRAIAPGYPPRDGAEAAGSTILRLAPGARRTVEVRTSGDRPVADAVVRDLSSGFVLGRTDGSGRLGLDLPPDGEAALLVETSDGWRASFRWNVPGDPAPVHLLAIPASTPLAGRVVNRETRLPLPGAFVWPSKDPARIVLTSKTGAFRLSSAGRVDEIQAAAPGYRSAVLPRAKGDSLELSLQPSSGLIGTVADEAGGSIPGAEIRVIPQDTGSEEIRRRAATDGSFHVSGLKPGQVYTLRAEQAGFSPSSRKVRILENGSAPPQSLVLRPGRTARGRTLDGTGRPVAGARIELVLIRSPEGVVDPGTESPRRAWTGPDGRFEVPSLPAGWFTLRIERAGFAPLERTGIEVPAGGGAADLGRFLLTPGAALSGAVLDPEGRPVPGAEIWVLPHGTQDFDALYARGPAAKTGDDGRFVLQDLPAGPDFTLDVCRKGFQPAVLPLPELSSEPLRAVLQPAASLSGRVLDPRGAPVDGARVRAWRAGENPDAPESYRPCLRNEGAADTDGEGRFTLDALPPGWWTLRSRDGRFLDATREHLHLSEGERLRGIELTLGEAGMVSGRVLTAEGEPAGETQVQANGRPAPPVSVAGDGGYRIEGVQPGEQTLEAWGPGGERASGRLVVRPGENHLDLKLGPAGKRHEIRGRVTGPGGEPIGSAEVQAGGSPATLQTSTASDGGFDLSVGDGDYTLSARKPGYAAGDATVHVAGAPVDGIEIRLGRAGALTGHLAGLAPRDLRIAKIEAAGSGEARFDGLVSSEGSYSIPDLPSGNWEVTARAGNRSAAGTVQLPEGEAEAVLDLTFPPTSEVSGWVLGPDGEPVADAAVRLFNPGGPGLSTRTRPDGGFRLEAEDGTYRLLSYKEGYLSATREEPVTVGGEPVSDLELHLGAAATVRGRILGLAPWDRAQGIVASNGAGLVSVGKLDFEGGYALPGLRPGTWEIAARHGDRQAIARIEILPGQTEVDLDLDFPAP